MEKEIKNRLDKGESVNLDLREYGPLKVATKLGLVKLLFILLPATSILIMIAIGELGISGRTVDTYSNRDTFTAGKYFEIARTEADFYNRAPPSFTGVWSQCVEYGDEQSIGHVATIPYERNLDENYFKMETPTCSTEDDVTIRQIRDECYEQNPGGDEGTFFSYNVTSLRNYELVFKDPYRQNIFSEYVGEVNVFMGEATVGPCSGVDGGPGAVFFVNASKVDGRQSIVDDSWRLGNTTRERWILDSSASMTTGNHNTGNGLIIECDGGCLETIVEWILSGTGDQKKIEDTSSFFSIWYEGMNFGEGESPNPRCDETVHSSLYHWTDNSTALFSGSGCEGSISSMRIKDGGQHNVTVVSSWAIWLIIVGCILSFIYYACTRSSNGYNLLTYEGISKICYMDANPTYAWVDGESLEVVLLRPGVVSSRIQTKRLVLEE